MPEADLLSDERLVGLTIEGDREAFGQIVARYQSPICALALACLLFGACGWMMVNAVRVDDHWVAVPLLVLSIAAWLLIGRAILCRPERTPKVFSAVWWGLAFVNLTIVNLRWGAWFGGEPVHQFPTRLAPWAVNYWIVLLFATVRIAWWLRRYFLALPDARRAARFAIGIFLAVMLAGAALLAAIK